MLALKVDASAFRQALRNRAANLKVGAQRRIVLFALDFYVNVQQATPILTGAARGDWQAGLNNNPTQDIFGIVRPPAKVDWQAYGQTAQEIISGFQSGDTIYISNPSPYIAGLNAGTSKQAPAMFVETTLANSIATFRSMTGGISNG